MPTLNLQVGASADDCRKKWDGSSWDFSTDTVGQNVGYYSSTNPKNGGGMRFTGVTIPNGATIITAYLTMRARLSESGTVAKSRIQGEQNNAAAAFSDVADYDGRVKTTASVDWDSIPAWTVSEDYDSPEIKTIIQELVDDYSGLSSADIVIFWEDHEGRSDASAYRTVYSYDGLAVRAPKLHIEYTLPPQTISPSAIASLEAFGNPAVLPGAVIIQPSAIASLEAFGSPTLKFTFNIFPSAIESAETFGTPLVIPGTVIIQPSGIASLEAFGTPLVFYDQVIIPTGIPSAEAFGTPTISFILLIKPKSIPSAEAFGTLKVLREIIHIILDGQYTQGSPGVNRIYIIGKDAEGNPVYGTSLNQTEIDLVGERLDFNQDLSIPTTAKAADVAAAAVAKARLTGSRGFIVIPPNCGQELWDVVQVTDKPTAQSQQKYRIIAASFDYEPLRHRYQHKLILGAP